MEDAPATHPVAIEIKQVDERVEASAHSPDRIWFIDELEPSVPQQGCRVERWVSNERLRIDREPAPVRVPEDVAGAQVLMQHDGLRRAADEVPCLL